jgi:hypothetical protein
MDIKKSSVVKHFSAASNSDLMNKIRSFDMLDSPKAQATAALLDAKQSITNSAAILGSGIKNRTDDLLMKGLSQADSHLQPEIILKRRKGKLRRVVQSIVIGGTVLIILGVAGLFFYKNSPSLQVGYASMRSGIHAQMPGYLPVGYTFASPIAFQRNSVTIAFTSPTKTTSWELNETGSTWDSTTLLDNFIVPLNIGYRTALEAGRTIYTYGPGNATWVNGGIWYRISGSADLSSDQLVAIATSF